MTREHLSHKRHEARRIASNIAKLPALLGAVDHSELDFPEGGNCPAPFAKKGKAWPLAKPSPV
jgi:hypothetical protein